MLLLTSRGRERWHAFGPANVGHEQLECGDCHRPARGTTRQQAQANVRFLLGHAKTKVAFGHEPVTNDVCQECHARPRDRHPVSRFVEPRFEKARAVITANPAGGL